jgi:hypothetical protein
LEPIILLFIWVSPISIFVFIQHDHDWTISYQLPDVREALPSSGNPNDSVSAIAIVVSLVVVTVTVIALICCGLVIYYRAMRASASERTAILTTNDLDDFHKGKKSSETQLELEDFAQSGYNRLPYNKERYEIKKCDFQIGNLITSIESCIHVSVMRTY